VIDKLPAPTTQSRAIVVHTRSLEMFDQMGIAEPIIGSGVKTGGMLMFAAGRELTRLGLSQVDSAFPFSLLTS
jgi:2-polyprenyl-6-methoxyphenol hydroxylase-like FAD-dependent oxidoreductase